MSGYYKPHISLELQSRTRTRGSIEDYFVSLSHQIKFSQKPSKTYWLRLENIQIPKSYYDIDSNFNRIQWIETSGGTFFIDVPVGNYTITELLTELESLMDALSLLSGDTNSFTFTYDDITNKIDITWTGGSSAVSIDTIANGSTINQVLGLGKADTTNITGGDSAFVMGVDGDTFDAPNCVDLHTKSFIVIETDLSSNNYYTPDAVVHLGVRVPMLVDRNEVQYFGNHDGHLSLMNSKAPLSSLQLTLKDEFGNPIDLCEVDWSCEVNIYELTELHKSGHGIAHPNISILPARIGSEGHGLPPIRKKAIFTRRDRFGNITSQS